MTSKNIMTLVEGQRQQIAAALPAGVSEERVIRMARTALATNDLLGKCMPRSVLGSIIECAQLGLEPGITGHLVPFYDSKAKGYRAQLIADYRGLMALARRSGEIDSIYADVVHARDEFVEERGTAPSLRHVPYRGEEPGEVVAAYAVAHWKSGAYQFEVVPKAELDKVRDQVLGKIKESARKYAPWTTSEEAMQKKTAVRRLCKFLPISTEDASLQRAIILDEQADRGEQRLGATLEAVPQLEPPEEEESLSAEEVEEFQQQIADAEVGNG